MLIADFIKKQKGRSGGNFNIPGCLLLKTHYMCIVIQLP